MPLANISELSSVQTLGGDKPPATEEVVSDPCQAPTLSFHRTPWLRSQGGLGDLGAGRGSRRRTALPRPCGLSSPPCRGSTFHTSFPGIVSSVITAPDAETSRGLWKGPGRKVRPSLRPPASGRERGPQPSPAWGLPGGCPGESHPPSPLWLPPGSLSPGKSLLGADLSAPCCGVARSAPHRRTRTRRTRSLTGGCGDQAGKCVGAAGGDAAATSLASLPLLPTPPPPSPPRPPLELLAGSQHCSARFPAPLLLPSLPAGGRGSWAPACLPRCVPGLGAGWEQDGRSQALLPPHAVSTDGAAGELGLLGPPGYF